MNDLKDKAISTAALSDIPSLVQLLNSAYRGESSKEGWTTEAGLIEGEVRTDEATLFELMQKEGVVFLRFVNDENKIIGCVNLQQHNDKMYLGMFSVSPKLQGGGIGKRLLAAAEQHAVNTGCDMIYMHVISDRIELIDWYKRCGYVDTGRRKKFQQEELTGRHLKPLEFMIMEKQVK